MLDVRCLMLDELSGNCDWEINILGVWLFRFWVVFGFWCWYELGDVG